MRRINSEFRTVHMSEEGQQLSNRDYFGYVEMDDYACYVLADSLDEELSLNSAKLVVESIIRDFTAGPSMGKGRLEKYIKRAHSELLQQQKGMHLKASVVIAVTDYQKIRWCHAGNSRFYLVRNGRILKKTADQSLTQRLLAQEQIPLDQAATHEERNNLYSFLGGRKQPEVLVSAKTKLEPGDIFALFTRGVWELCEDQELIEIFDAAREPEEVLNQTEDLILRCQETRRIDNYTLAVTFVNKVYQPPKKPWSMKRLLMFAVLLVFLASGIGLSLYLRHKSIQSKEELLEKYMEQGEAYLQYDNYKKAAEEYKEAEKLADGLKRKEESEEANRYKRLAEQIVLADEALADGDYQKAWTLYLSVRELGTETGNVGKSYVDFQLGQTQDHMEVFDLLTIGEKKEEYGNLEGAIQAYKEAKEKAAALYYEAGKAQAMEKQAVAEEKLEKAELEDRTRQEKEAEAAAAEAAKQQQESEASQELEHQQKANDQQNAIELENKGNQLLEEGNYESAITFYQTAQAIYIRLELPELADGINKKIGAARAGIEAQKAIKESETQTEEPKEYGPGMNLQ